MAGRRQHYIPRLLQRGFLDASLDGAERTWLHRCGAEAKLVGIRDVGVEDWFYSRKSPEGARTLDDAITDLERDLSASVEGMRKVTPGNSINADEAAHTVVHLVMRTAHLRRAFSSVMVSLIDEIESVFTDPARLGEIMGLDGLALTPVVLDAIRNGATELESSGIPAALSERVLAFEVREFGEPLVEQLGATFSLVFPQLSGSLVGRVREAHNSSLAVAPEKNAWVAALSTFEWTIESGTDLILPDAVALVREDDRSLKPLLFAKAADISVVTMPLLPNRMLVGRVTGSAPINFSAFNMQAAASCEDFFIGAKRFDENELSTLIGSALTSAITEETTAAVREAEQIRSRGDTVTDLVKPNASSQQEFSYSVRLADFGDESRAKEFSDVLSDRIGQIAHHFPLHELDGFTIAVDYYSALAMLDRGDPNLPPLSSSAHSYGQSVAKSITVVRDGARKEHLVIAAEIAEAWLSSEPKVRAVGIYTLVRMLAGIAHSTLYASNQEASFSLDVMGRALHLAVATVPADYWGARLAASFEPDQGQAYADLFIDSLDFAEREITKERNRIPDSGDIRNTTMRASECLSAALGHAADWLGHRDGLADGQVFAGDDLSERLKTRGLDRWIVLFGRDLAACYNRDGALDLGMAVNLSSHFERLLWSFGIYCWPDDDEVRCLVTDQFFRPQPPSCC